MTFVLFDNHAHAMSVTREQLLPRPLQLQPVRAKPFGERAWRRCSRHCRWWTSTTSATCPPPCGPHWTSTACRSSSVECAADEIPAFAPLLATAATNRLALTTFRLDDIQREGHRLRHGDIQRQAASYGQRVAGRRHGCTDRPVAGRRPGKAWVADLRYCCRRSCARSAWPPRSVFRQSSPPAPS